MALKHLVRKDTIVLLLLLSAISAPVLANSLQVRQIENSKFGLKAMMILVAPEDNRGFFAIDVSRRTDGDDISKHWKPDYAFLVNGGYFEQDFSPVGFVRIDGRTLHKRRSLRLSGFVAIDRRGTLRLLTKKDNVSGYRTVIQSGPHLINPGGSIGIKSDTGQTARRTVIGVTRDQTIVLAVTEPISLSDLARAMLAELPSLDRLLNLDGGPSTALKTGSIQVLNVSPVRNYIGKRSGNKTLDRKPR